MSFIGSSERWGDQSFARLCQIVVESNDGIGQQVMENRTDLLDLLSVEELEKGDDLGLSVAFLAVYYDQPDIITYLHRRGVDLNKPCDPMGFGSPMFYAINLEKKRLISLLHQFGYRVQNACDTMFQQTPVHYASRRDNVDIVDLVDAIVHREDRAKQLLLKNILRNRERRKFLKTVRKVVILQKLIRGRQARHLVAMVRRGEIILESEEESVHEESASLGQLDEASNEDEEGSKG